MRVISLFGRAALFTAVAASATIGTAQTAHADPMRIGYWTSGVSLGFGAVLEAQKFLQQRGLDVTDSVVTRWMPEKKAWVIVSKPGGLPL